MGVDMKSWTPGFLILFPGVSPGIGTGVIIVSKTYGLFPDGARYVRNAVFWRGLWRDIALVMSFIMRHTCNAMLWPGPWRDIALDMLLGVDQAPFSRHTVTHLECNALAGPLA